MNSKLGLRASVAITFLSVLLAACSASKEGSPDKRDDLPRIEASQAGLDAFVRRLQGKQIRLYRGDGTDAGLFIYIDEKGILHHCNSSLEKYRSEHREAVSCLENPFQSTASPLRQEEFSDARGWCQSAGGAINGYVNNLMDVYAICVSDRDKVVHTKGAVLDEFSEAARNFPVAAGEPVYVLMRADNTGKHEGYFTFRGLETSSLPSSPSADDKQSSSRDRRKLEESLSLGNERDRISYAIGMALGKQLSEIRDEIDADAVERGLVDVFNGETPQIDEEKGKAIMEAFGERMRAKGKLAGQAQEMGTPVGSDINGAYKDFGSAQCIDISRRWVVARRRVDSLEGTPAGAIAAVEFFRIQNGERVFANCEGGESREEQEYVAQHPEESRLRNRDREAVADATGAPKSDRDRAFSEILSVAGVAGAGWGESQFIVSARASTYDAIRSLCLPLMRIAEPVGMGVSIKYTSEDGEGLTAECPTHAQDEGSQYMQSQANQGSPEQAGRDRIRGQMLEDERKDLSRLRQDAAMRRERCESYRTEMESEVRKGNASAAVLAEGLRNRGCADTVGASPVQP